MNFDVIGWTEYLLTTFIPVSMIVSAIVVFILEAGFGLRAEYGRYIDMGRYNKSKKGFSAPVAWCLQESPAFLVPCVFLYFGGLSVYDKQSGGLNLNVLFLYYFMIHYFNR